jgi:hypothetical protein
MPRPYSVHHFRRRVVVIGLPLASPLDIVKTVADSVAAEPSAVPIVTSALGLSLALRLPWGYELAATGTYAGLLGDLGMVNDRGGGHPLPCIFADNSRSAAPTQLVAGEGFRHYLTPKTVKIPLY